MSSPHWPGAVRVQVLPAPGGLGQRLPVLAGLFLYQTDPIVMPPQLREAFGEIGPRLVPTTPSVSSGP